MKKLLNIFFIVFFIFILTIAVKAKISDQQKKELKMNQDENIVLLGDQVFSNYQTSYIYDDLPIINSSKLDLTSGEALKNMQFMTYQYNPTKVFVLVGINDIYGLKSELPSTKLINQTSNNINNIAKLIRKNRPKTQVYIISILPINDNLLEYATKDEDREIINMINSKLKEYCHKDDKISYIDANEKLKDESGQLKEEYTTDGLNLNDLGYVKLTSILMKYILD